MMCSPPHCCFMLLQAIWAKGYTELLKLVESDGALGEKHTAIDCYGYGDDLHEVGPSLAAWRPLSWPCRTRCSTACLVPVCTMG